MPRERNICSSGECLKGWAAGLLDLTFLLPIAINTTTDWSGGILMEPFNLPAGSRYEKGKSMGVRSFDMHGVCMISTLHRKSAAVGKKDLVLALHKHERGCEERT
jgi:hypothetical protein